MNWEDIAMLKRVLAVDDDDMNLMRIKKILRTEYDVFFASSGVEALDTMKREQMDLVLLDIEMPRMNGFETFERMKEFAPDTPVIFLTASGQEDDVSAIRLGAVNYLKKPFPPQELILRISQVLEKR
jgi:CheY-like chemotaxis protein